MGAELPPYPGNHGDAVGSDETFHNPLFKDEEGCTAEAPPSPHDGDGGDDNGEGGVDKPSRSRTLRARVALAIGLVFEVSATVWAFQEAVAAGALDEDGVDCGNNGRLFTLYGSYLVMDTCDTQIEADTFFNFTADWGTNLFEGYVGCDNLTDTLAAIDTFEERCSCYADKNPADLSSCSWAAVSSPSDDICYAQGVINNSSDETDTARLYAYNFFDGCWATIPSGTSALTITALVVALASELLEAFVGFNYWKDTDKRTALSSLAPAVFEALGVVVVASVMLSLPGFYGVSSETFERLPTFFGLAWATIPIVVVGALAEITMEFSDRVAGRLPYLGAVGSGLVWLGTAMLEVVVISYLLWTSGGFREPDDIAYEAAGVFVVELLGLVCMWIAHGLWSRAKVLRAAVKRLELPLRKRVSTGLRNASLPLQVGRVVRNTVVFPL